MSRLCDEGWQSVNAYYDGEMSEKERNVFEARLQQEPALADALYDLKEISLSLRRLAPVQVQLPPVLHLWRRILNGAFAAVLLLAVVWFFYNRDFGQSPADIHTAFAGQSFRADASAGFRKAGQYQDILPDLTLVGFRLVTTQKRGDSVIGHYSGRNDCRLTLIVGTEHLKIPVDKEIQAAAWYHNGNNYLLLFQGMRTDRFQLLVQYLQQSGTIVRWALDKDIKYPGSCV